MTSLARLLLLIYIFLIAVAYILPSYVDSEQIINKIVDDNFLENSVFLDGAKKPEIEFFPNQRITINNVSYKDQSAEIFIDKIEIYLSMFDIVTGNYAKPTKTIISSGSLKLKASNLTEFDFSKIS